MAIGGWLLWPDATRAYLEDLPSLVGFRHPQFLRSTFSPYGFFSLLAPGQDTLVYVLTVVAAIGAIWWFWWYWRGHRSDLAGLFSLSVVLTLLISPRVVVYDWTLLLIPAVILASQRIDLRDTWLGIGAIVATGRDRQYPIRRGPAELPGLGNSNRGSGAGAGSHGGFSG